MYKLNCIYVLFIAALVCLASTDCRRAKRSRNMKFEICRECKELLREEITNTLEDLSSFSICLEKNISSGSVLDKSESYMKKAKDDMVSSLPKFIQQIKLILEIWEHNKVLPNCTQNIEKHLTRILCLTSRANKKGKHCSLKAKIQGPDIDDIFDYTSNYVRMVYGTLRKHVLNFF